jgi:hypothetical protein
MQIKAARSGERSIPVVLCRTLAAHDDDGCNDGSADSGGDSYNDGGVHDVLPSSSIASLTLNIRSASRTEEACTFPDEP